MTTKQIKFALCCNSLYGEQTKTAWAVIDRTDNEDDDVKTECVSNLKNIAALLNSVLKLQSESQYETSLGRRISSTVTFHRVHFQNDVYLMTAEGLKMRPRIFLKYN